MNRNVAGILLLSGLLFACVPVQQQAQTPPPPAPPVPAAAAVPVAPPAERWVGIRVAKCARLLELSNEDRAAAAMFYIGYQASRYGAGAINVNALGNMESLAFRYCAAYPDRPAAEAFAQAYAIDRAAGR
jgi:hypothetical protein